MNHVYMRGRWSISIPVRVSSLIFIQCLLFVNTGLLNAQPTVLLKGGIAVVGYNGGNGPATSTSDEFTIMALQDINAGTEIKITDRGWDGVAFFSATFTGDGAFIWTVGSFITRGTVFKFSVTPSNVASSTVGRAVNMVPVNGTLSFLDATSWAGVATLGAFTTVGDQVIIYQGPESTPSFIFGINTSNNPTFTPANGQWQNVTSANITALTSALPTGLVNNAALDGTVAATALGFTLGFTSANLAYKGPKSGTPDFLLKQIATRANWDQVGGPFDITPGSVAAGAYFTGGQPIFLLSFALPVTLVSFTAESRGDINQLIWKTADEFAFRHFEVERSTDGRIFSLLSIVSSGTLNGHYRYDDPSDRTSNASYYRLKMVDNDGRYKYSQVVMVRNALIAALKLFPNPVSSVMQITVPEAGEGTLALQVFDAQGRLLITRTYERTGGVMAVTLDVSALPRGKYFLKAEQGSYKDKTVFLKE
ncbi:T9SS type A sorting domain-containing protein [Terrimonas sp. NA20]|uniref:T9SS type A sorting domain-containing protein n=1 Tax=Terrimonas ginsenosidimutans TaxID=2908004 RepID=A0ABS9KT33_9BACT|nr:T9SS type A sorting domain-containing protein [Terrimonas ginsenosidimutans]MCG2615488.1 T9SS type A sorting domain-containing protein [Terrimonas ginsenosidimutans]